jgi:hypothetical protein
MSIVAVPLEEVDTKSITITEEIKKTWSWKDTDGKKNTRTVSLVEVGYDGKPFSFEMSKVRSNQGVQISTKFGSIFMSLNLTDEQSQLITEKIDNPLRNLLFKKRSVLFKQGDKMTHVSEMIMFTGLVKKGDPKNDGTGKNWPDQLTITVPSKKERGQPVIDSSVVSVEDIDGNALPFNAVEKDIEEVIIEVMKIDLGKDFTVRGRFRLIVSSGKAAVKVVSKRKLGSSASDDNSAETSRAIEGPQQKKRLLPVPQKSE